MAWLQAAERTSSQPPPGIIRPESLIDVSIAWVTLLRCRPIRDQYVTNGAFDLPSDGE